MRTYNKCYHDSVSYDNDVERDTADMGEGKLRWVINQWNYLI